MEDNGADTIKAVVVIRFLEKGNLEGHFTCNVFPWAGNVENIGHVSDWGVSDFYSIWGVDLVNVPNWESERSYR